MTTKPASDHLRDLVLLRRVRDRIDRDHAQPLDVEALARGVHMSAGHLSRQFKLDYGESPGTFSTRFSELVGMAPSAYARAAAQATAGLQSCVVKHATRPVLRDPAGNMIRIQERR